MNTDKHPSKDICSTLSSVLAGKKIVLCITGSVAAVKAPEMARLLMRHGAEVYPVMTEAACRIIHPDLMHWSCGNETVTKLDGRIQHVSLAGNVEGKADLVLIYPSTANTLGKIASGIDDTTVTTLATTALGEGIPMILVPAMHEPMYRHPVVKENIEKLKKIGIDVILPCISEGKAKAAEPAAVLPLAVKKLSTHSLKNCSILITAGRTVEYIDPVRVISNNASGRMGIALAEEAFKKGATVTLILGMSEVKSEIFPFIKIIRVETGAQMLDAVETQLKASSFSFMLAAAAPGDWQPEKTESKKISTHSSSKLNIELIPVPKIIDRVKIISPETKLVAFRAQHKLTDAGLVSDALERLKKADADFIAANDVGREKCGFMTETNEIFLINKKGEVLKSGLSDKNTVASFILDNIS